MISSAGPSSRGRTVRSSFRASGMAAAVRPAVPPGEKLLQQRHLVQHRPWNRRRAEPEGVPKVVFRIPGQTQFLGGVQTGGGNPIRPVQPRSGDQHHGGAEHRDGLHLGVVHVVRDEGEVHQPLGHIVIGFPGVIVVKGERPAGGEKVPKHRGEQIGGQTAHRGNPQRLGPARPGQRPGLLPQQAPLFRHRNKVPALGSEFHLPPPSAPHEQGTAQVLLQRAQVPADRRLGDIEGLGGSRDAAQLCHRKKDFNALLSHGITSFAQGAGLQRQAPLLPRAEPKRNAGIRFRNR